jgi:CheY-like chemotaxis protein
MPGMVNARETTPSGNVNLQVLNKPDCSTRIVEIAMPQNALDPESVSLLVVDANTHSRSLVCGLLRGAGYTGILSAEGAQEAVTILRRLTPQVLILEWEDEGLNGPLFARRVRSGSISTARSIPIILVTSKASMADVRQARAVGVNEYVVKPLSAQSLATRVAEVLLRPREFVDSHSYVGPCRRRQANPTYEGPLRRMSDPVEELIDDPDEFAKKNRARIRVSALEGALRRLRPGDRTGVRLVYASTQELTAVALDIGDPQLEKAGRSLQRYLTGVGASAQLDPEIVATHLDAMTQLLTLANVEREMRESVASGLDAVVTKKLRRAATL